MKLTSKPHELNEKWAIDFWLPGEDAPLHYCEIWAKDEADAMAQCLDYYGESVESIHMIMPLKEYEELQRIMDLEMLLSFSEYLERNGTSRPIGNQD